MGESRKNFQDEFGVTLSYARSLTDEFGIKLPERPDMNEIVRGLIAALSKAPVPVSMYDPCGKRGPCGFQSKRSILIDNLIQFLERHKYSRREIRKMEQVVKNIDGVCIKKVENRKILEFMEK